MQSARILCTMHQLHHSNSILQERRCFPAFYVNYVVPILRIFWQEFYFVTLYIEFEFTQENVQYIVCGMQNVNYIFICISFYSQGSMNLGLHTSIYIKELVFFQKRSRSRKVKMQIYVEYKCLFSSITFATICRTIINFV